MKVTPECTPTPIESQARRVRRGQLRAAALTEPTPLFAVVGAGDAKWTINRDYFVPDHFVYDGVGPCEYLDRSLEKALHQGGEFGGTQSSGELRRTSDVSIEHRNFDLGPPCCSAKTDFAFFAKMRIARPLRATMARISGAEKPSNPA